MQSLQDFYYFAKVAEHGGYARAARALGIPKSRLSRHVAALEGRLGVRLVNRSTRRFAVTETGLEVRRHAEAMMAEADAAVAAVELARAQPRGLLKVSCPVALAQSALTSLVPRFLTRHPGVRLVVEVSNRRVDVLAEGFDVAIRVRARPSGEDGLVMCSFGHLDELLVASPGYLEHAGRPRHPKDLDAHATLGFGAQSELLHWELTGPDATSTRLMLTPRLVCHDFPVLRAATLAGLGIVLLPESVVRGDLDAGLLERVLPDWRAPQGIFHVVFPSRRGMLPAVRAFIDFLAEGLPGTAALAKR